MFRKQSGCSMENTSYKSSTFRLPFSLSLSSSTINLEILFMKLRNEIPGKIIFCLICFYCRQRTETKFNEKKMMKYLILHTMCLSENRKWCYFPFRQSLLPMDFQTRSELLIFDAFI